MKKMMVLLSLLLLQITSHAEWRKAMLRLKHEIGRSISVSIDGRKFDKIGRTITVGDLTAGIHKIKIYKYNTNGYGYSTGILIYQGTIKVRPGRIYYATATDQGLDIEENCCLDDYGHWNNNDNWNQENNLLNPVQDHEDNWNNNHAWNHNHENGNYTDNNWDSYNGQMSEGRFLQLIDQIKKASFETSKVSVAKQGLTTNRISCKQLVSILNEFSFESSKLQFAKDAYSKVLDKNNYFLINDAFIFQSSKDDLLEFLDKVH